MNGEHLNTTISCKKNNNNTYCINIIHLYAYFDTYRRSGGDPIVHDAYSAASVTHTQFDECVESWMLGDYLLCHDEIV